jgi:hypothetical protein
VISLQAIDSERLVLVAQVDGPVLGFRPEDDHGRFGNDSVVIDPKKRVYTPDEAAVIRELSDESAQCATDATSSRQAPLTVNPRFVVNRQSQPPGDTQKEST